LRRIEFENLGVGMGNAFCQNDIEQMSRDQLEQAIIDNCRGNFTLADNPDLIQDVAKVEVDEDRRFLLERLYARHLALIEENLQSEVVFDTDPSEPDECLENAYDGFPVLTSSELANAETKTLELMQEKYSSNEGYKQCQFDAVQFELEFRRRAKVCD
jgi:hypothetical protein